MISTYFRQTIEFYGITGKKLSEVAGIAENHISEFRRGKRAIGSENLWRLLIAMDEIEPGSRKFFCNLLAGNGVHTSLGEKLEDLIMAADDEEIERAMLAIAKKWRAKKFLIGV